MASTISTINQSLVDERVQEALRYVLPAFSAFSMRVEREGMIQSDSVYVPFGTDPTAQSKTAGTLVTSNGGAAGVQVQLSNFYGAGWDVAEGKMSPAVFASYWADQAAGSVYSLAKQVVDAALALVTATNYDNVELTDKLTCAVADFGLADLASLWAISERKIKQRQRTLILNSHYAGAVMGDSAISLNFATANGTNPLATGMLPTLIGMNTMAYAALPANSENLGGIVLGKAAILGAVAPPAALAGAGDGAIYERRIITEPTSGLSALYTSTVGAGGLVQGECAILYGVAKGQNAAVRLVTA
jgi:hypothetical protein